MAKLDIQKLKELYDKATAGEWEDLGFISYEDVGILPKNGQRYGKNDDWVFITDDDFLCLLALHNAFPSIVKKLEAAEELEKKSEIWAAGSVLRKVEEADDITISRLRRKAEAADRLAEAVRGMDSITWPFMTGGTLNSAGQVVDDAVNGVINHWRSQRDTALAQYEESIKE